MCQKMAIFNKEKTKNMPMNKYKVIGVILGVLTLLGAPLSLWINMQIKDSQHELKISALECADHEKKIEIKELRAELVRTIRYIDAENQTLSNKIDQVPQKVFDLMNSVNQVNHQKK